MNEVLKKGLIIISLVGIGVAAGRFAAPTKTIEKEVIKEVEKIVEKRIIVKDTSEKKNKVTVRLVTIHPDGTKTIETRITDKSEIEVTQNENSTKTDDKSLDKSIEKVVEYSKDDYYLGLGIKTNLTTGGLAYGLHAQRRILGPIHLGIFGYSDLSLGANAGISF